MMRRTRWLLGFGVAVVAAGTVAYTLYPGKRSDAVLDAISNEVCIVAPATPPDPASDLPLIAPRAVPAEARCPVCGMYPARYPRWAAQVIFQDGATHFFDSPVDLFGFMNGVGRHSSPYTMKEAVAQFVTDFDSGEWVAAETAFYVRGSDVLGPMRDADLPAFGSRDSAEAFARNRGGKVLAHADVTPEVLRPLSRNLHRH